MGSSAHDVGDVTPAAAALALDGDVDKLSDADADKAGVAGAAGAGRRRVLDTPMPISFRVRKTAHGHYSQTDFDLYGIKHVLVQLAIEMLVINRRRTQLTNPTSVAPRRSEAFFT